MISAAALGGCDDSYEEETLLFERAEQAYAVGDYWGANELYDDFLTAHPYSPLAPIARQRLRTIEREWDNVLGRNPAPVYVSPYRQETPEGTQDTPLTRIEAPDLPQLGE